MYELDFKRTTNRYTDEELLDNIKAVWDAKGSQPFISDMDKEPSTVSFGTYFNRFGSWRKALEIFVKNQNNGVIKIKSKENRKTVGRKTISKSMRYDVLKNDNFKCVLCGDSPAVNNETILEIDHIIAVSNGGKNNIDNLRTLCKRCNIGKFNK